MYATADLVISRAGAGSLAEFEFLGLKALLIPLPAAQSRGDQLLNAQDFVDSKLGLMLPQSQISLDKVLELLTQLASQPTSKSRHIDSTSQVFLAAINKVLKLQ